MAALMNEPGSGGDALVRSGLVRSGGGGGRVGIVRALVCFVIRRGIAAAGRRREDAHVPCAHGPRS